jgi:hypothetical protein
MSQDMSVDRLRAVFSLAVAMATLSGCLAGERPPITTLYPDPTSQVPAVTGQAPLVSGSGTRVETYEFYGTPGTTFYYGEIPTQPPSTYPYGYGPYPHPGERMYEQGLKPGQPRYVYPGDEVRCDNLERSCVRWSDRRGRYVLDDKATRTLYGGRDAGPYYRYYRQQ